VDFARDVFPWLIRELDVRAYRHEDRATRRPLYWRDVGTPEAYHATSMALLGSEPSMDLYDSSWPIRSADGAQFDGPSGLSETGRRFEINSIIARGVNIGQASVYKSVLFPGVVLEPGVHVRNSVLMPGVVIQRGSVVNRAIIDANTMIGPEDNIGYNRQRDLRRFHVARNGVVVVSPDHVSPFFTRDVTRSVRVPVTL
jgi:glucose-1-phosphate adenylyltransferase